MRQRVRKMHEKGHAATTFRLDELHALERACQSMLMTRGPVDGLTRSPAFSSAYAKILRMRDKAQREQP